MSNHHEYIGNKLFEFVDINQEGYAIFDANDFLVYCNKAYGQIMGFERNEVIGKTFSQILAMSFEAEKGVKTEHKDVGSFLARVSQQWRSSQYRLFEVETHDGRWFLLSELANETGDVLIQTKQITEQKNLEKKLLSSRDKLRRLALTDELTHVANRRCFVESVEAELSRCQRLRKNVAYMILDLDYFKSVNDTYGHQAGDEVLKHVASLVKETLRDYDIFGRIGGEEFAVFLGQTEAKEALEIAERIRSIIENNPLSHQDVSIQLSTSIGISLAYAMNCSYVEMYNQADKALYQAKNEGRNRCVLYESYCGG